MTDQLRKLEEKIGYQFREQSLLKQALSHSSYTYESHIAYSHCNERLEFLGDAVLELVSSEYLYSENPEMPEGELTKLRASLVCEPSLAASARELNLTEFLYLGKGEQTTGGGQRDSILSDAFEAIIGAIYLDGNYQSAKTFICKFVLSDIENKQLFYDSKTILQEIVQGMQGKEISYVIEKEEGPDHDRTYESSCRIGNQKYGTGIGKTKKAAQQHAAYETILILRQEKK